MRIATRHSECNDILGSDDSLYLLGSRQTKKAMFGEWRGQGLLGSIRDVQL